MTVTTQTFHIATCTLCGTEFDELGDRWLWDETPELALAQVASAPDSGWVLADGTVICPTADAAHDQARGGPSPT